MKAETDVLFISHGGGPMPLLGDPGHLAIGRALQALDYDNLLVIGSGFSFHNMQAFFAPGSSEMRARKQGQ